MLTIVLLTVSNIFMSVAWYGHLKHKHRPIWLAVLFSWGIALLEYVFQVPANRVGAQVFTLTQLKIIQECLTLVVFTIFVFFVFHERPRWNILISYALIVAAVYFAFRG